jgi:outer membrane protein OmpA-like peptidoglycan-associated protein/tetratricopeptide (TPR) repeat protein
MFMQKRITLLFFIISLFSFSQKRQLNLAENSFNSLSYAKAIKHYQKYIKKSGDSIVLNKLAVSHYKLGNYNNAYQYFNLWELLDENDLSSFSAEELYLYASSALNSESADRYISLMNYFVKQHPTDSRASFYKRRSLLETYRSKFNTQYTITPFELNSKYSDFGFYAQNDKSFFVSKRAKTKLDSWSGNYFSSLYNYNFNEDISKSRVVKFRLNGDGKSHRSTSALNSTGDQLYLTQSTQNAEGNSYLQIIRYSLDNKGKWSNPESLSINGNDYNTAHPSIDKSGSILYFSSDRPGGYGQSDIYRVDINADSSLEEPINLGPKINTASRESFPFIDDDDSLYFASDGHPSYGGLDIFGIAINDPSAMAINLGKPLNTEKDDFAYFSAEGKTYISSNREGGQGSDDIYKVKIENPIEFNCFGSISGLVINQQTGKPVANANVEVLDNMLQITVVETSDNGFYHIEELACGKQYTLRITEENHKVSTKQIDISRVYDHNEIATIALKPKLTVEGQLAAFIKGQEILYGFDKESYLAEGQKIIEKLAALLKQNSDKKIEIKSYTDTKGPENYNLWLSQQRSNYILNQLVQLGVSQSQLVSTGMGEFNPSRDCETTDCSYSKAEQRRTIFSLISEQKSEDLHRTVEITNPEPVRFAFDSKTFMTLSEKQTIDEIVSSMISDKTLKIKIIGHTDAIGPSQYNYELSRQRAEKIKKMIVKLGISENRIQIIPKGETQPLNNCANENCSIEQHRLNRRVEFEYY